MWLLEAGTIKRIESAIKAGVVPTAEQQAKFEAERYGSEDSDHSPRLLTVAGDKAAISISGVITKAPSLMMMIFGGGNTTYREINQAIAQADADAAVDEIELKIDSPGGQYDGLFDTLAAIQNAKTRIVATVSNQAASAAYAIAAQAQSITAVNRAARVGSIGVAAEFDLDDSSVTITSTLAPKKRPDVRTEEGVAMVREELDAMHELFVDSISSGRRVSMDKVNAEFGQGATLLADEALSRGMIDAIAAPRLRVVTSAIPTTAEPGGISTEAKIMDLTTLKSSHPDVFAAVVQEGVNQERDRVSAHLTMGEASGDMKTAVTAIKDGSAMTGTLQATYMAAGMARRDVTDRAADDVAAAAAANAADITTTERDESDAVSDLVARQFGYVEA